jgi:hypothetical protein
MKRSESLIAVRVYFLERALERMELAADDAESELRANPTDAATGRRVKALYALADETWTGIQALRARLSGSPSVIYYDRRLANPRARAARQALV